MSQAKTDSSPSEEETDGEVAVNKLDDFGKIMDLVGGFGFYQKRLYMVP